VNAPFNITCVLPDCGRRVCVRRELVTVIAAGQWSRTAPEVLVMWTCPQCGGLCRAQRPGNVGRWLIGYGAEAHAPRVDLVTVNDAGEIVLRAETIGRDGHRRTLVQQVRPDDPTPPIHYFAFAVDADRYVAAIYHPAGGAT
jgi:hypothetical protein